MGDLTLETMTITKTRLEGSIPNQLCANLTHPWLFCKPTKAVVEVPQPELTGSCFPQQYALKGNTTTTEGDRDGALGITKCARTLLCGCDCGRC